METVSVSFFDYYRKNTGGSFKKISRKRIHRRNFITSFIILASKQNPAMDNNMQISWPCFPPPLPPLFPIYRYITATTTVFQILTEEAVELRYPRVELRKGKKFKWTRDGRAVNLREKA